MSHRDIAIVGMACLFPKAPGLEAFWRNLRDGVDGIVEVPSSRWEPLFYDPASTAPDRFYAHRGGFVDEYAEFDAAGFGIMPVAARGAEPEQLLALQVAVDALADAGYADRDFPRQKASVILGRGNYIGAGTSRLVNITTGAQQLVETLRRLLPGLGEAELADIKRDFQARCGVYGPDTAIGLVPNLLASRIANRLDLQGSAYTLDAACASALVAVDHACRELQEGQADFVLAGGVHLCHDLVFWSVFSQLGALSRSQQIRPFDRRADGLLIGEGLGMLVLKRLQDARRSGDRVYAVIRGTGVASDGRDVSLMLPRVEGQVLALQRAYAAAGIDPAGIGMVEAHGTGTPAGDAAELETLRRVFGPAEPGAPRAVLGSVKSMIGHTMPAAGAAGLIKAALAAYHGVRLPTLHCEEPHPALEATRFRTLAAAEPWEGGPRLAAVNAFGFGGINAHVVLEAPEERTGAHGHGHAPAIRHDEVQPLVLAAPTQAALLEALASGRSGGEGPWRLAVLDPTEARLKAARAAVEAGRRRHGRDGVHFSAEGLVAGGGLTAFLFPGVEADFSPDVADLASRFGLPLPDLQADGLVDQGRCVILLNRFMEHVASAVGLRPDVLAGHSIGEWSGMVAAGMFEGTSLEEFIATLKPGMLQVADVTYLAVGAGAERVAPWVSDLAQVFVSHDNCPHQSILCGPQAPIEEALRRLRERRILCEILPFRSGFHSPSLEAHIQSYLSNFGRLSLTPPALPLWSATTCAPYPSDPAAIRDLFRDHLLRPVRFRELILALYEAGVRVFVQAGSGSLVAFVSDVLGGRPHLAVPLVASQRSGLEQLRRACAALWVEGSPVDLPRAGLSRGAAPVRPRQPLRLELGVPLVRIDRSPLAAGTPAAPPAAAGDPVAEAFAAGLRQIEAARDAVAKAYAAPPGAGKGAGPSALAPPRTPAPAVRPASPAPGSAGAGAAEEHITFSLEAFPELIDHSLIPQPPGWPVAADRAPAVPMTMSIELLMEAARRVEPGRIPVAVEKVLASSWIGTIPPVQVPVLRERLDADRIRVAFGTHVEGIVVLGDRYPEPPEPSAEAFGDPNPFPVPFEAIYRDGWLFHGPGYQGLRSIDACGTGGLRGTIEALPARGALLDNAGQFLGLWVMHQVENDQLAMPVKAGRIEFFGPPPEPGEVLDCAVWVRSFGRREVRADLELSRGGRVHARIQGWEDWRFHTGGSIYSVMRQPGKYLLADLEEDGVAVLDDPGWTSATFEFLARRFFSARDLDALGGIRRAQRHSEWIYGRIAAKDAVRALLFKTGTAQVFPIEIGIEPDASGRPRVRGPFPQDLRVSLAHKAGIACAVAAEGIDPGIDLEAVEARGPGFEALAFSHDEIALLPEGADRDEWITRFWSAKEAAGKARGTGLGGNPRSLRIRAVDADRILVDERWVRTRRRGSHVVAWTVQ